jgi:hypothetical protein
MSGNGFQKIAPFFVIATSLHRLQIGVSGWVCARAIHPVRDDILVENGVSRVKWRPIGTQHITSLGT